MLSNEPPLLAQYPQISREQCQGENQRLHENVTIVLQKHNLV